MSFQTPKNQFKVFLLFLIFFLTTNSVFAFQESKIINLSSIYKEIIDTNETSLTYEKVRIKDDINERRMQSDSLNFIEALEAILNKPVPLDSFGIISNVLDLSFIDVSANILTLSDLNIEEILIDLSEFEYLSFYDSNFSFYSIYESKVDKELNYDTVNFDHYSDYLNHYKKTQFIECEFSSFFQLGSTTVSGEFWLLDSKFKQGAYIAPVFDGNFTDFYLAGNTFDPIASSVKIQHPELIPENFTPRTQLRANLFGKTNQMIVEENEFLSNGEDQIIYIEGDFDYMQVIGNLFESRFYPSCTVANKFTFLENEVLQDLIFTDLILQGKNNDLHWKDIQGFKLAATQSVESILSENLENFGLNLSQRDSVFAQTSDVIFIPFRGDQEMDFQDEDFFQGLISSYYRIYKVFKENGQIDDANQTYVEMKDVELRKLEYDYKTYGGLENLIQWRLNLLLKFYTDYGTNPSRAIRISIFVVFLFSIFYFFFPSEWDTKSKKQLIEDYNLLIEKNEHGYFKPLVKLGFGFGKSLINALTLSLNSFVTLGFGTIPTTGLARYVCIIQGFIGWFLLSVFTASLINQVLF
jgi:hypothetical protein